ncbi:MAG: AmmeMemoRadiSam system protein A [Pseudomonadales bacterium]
MPSTEYAPDDRRRLLEIARASMTHAVHTGVALSPDEEDLNPALRAIRASFVTLHRHGTLRGCTGSLEAVQPLALDVARTACSTALADPRFYPVTATELADIDIEISVLSPLTPMTVRDEADLIAQLRPEVDGLVLTMGSRRATFLPKVWEQLPSAKAFVAALKRKAGLPEDFWSTGMAAWRYHTETFAEVLI